jgi:DNA-binding NarL/FixJ family response regulator
VPPGERGRIVTVPESFELAAVRDARARAAARRRAADVLRLAAAVAGYAAGQVSDGLSPVEAQCATWQAAEELTAIVVQLRRLGRVDPAGRRALALELAGAGVPRREIADRLGVTPSTVRGYLRSPAPAASSRTTR